MDAPALLIETTPSAIAMQPGDAPLRLSAVAYDTALHPLRARVALASLDTMVARVDAEGVVHAVAPGRTALLARLGEASTRVAVVVGARDTAASDVVRLDLVPHARYQTINGWEATVGIGLDDCDTVAVERYRPAIIAAAVRDMGLTRLRLEVPSGLEQRVDLFSRRRAGTLSFNAWKDVRYRPVNDDADPFNADPAGFQWGWLDQQVTRTVQPMRDALAARGERLYVNLQYVDFTLGTSDKTFLHMKAPEEYAELIEATFAHLYETYGWVPDAVEATLEPEHTLYDGADIGRSIVAAAKRLARHGWHPEFIAPSTTSVASAAMLFDEVARVSGVRPLVREIAYHRYQHVSAPALAAVARRARRDGIRTAMLEHIGADIDELFDDLQLGQVSAWQQYSIAYCSVSNASEGGSYFKFDQRDPTYGSLTMSSSARVLSSVFRHVRPGSTRVGIVSRDSASADAIAFDTPGGTVVVARSRAGARVLVRGLEPGRYGASIVSRLGAADRASESERVIAVGTDGALSAAIPRRTVLVIYPATDSVRASTARDSSGATSAHSTAHP